MSTTIGCPIPGASQPKEPVRLIDVAPILKNIELDIMMLHGKADELGESDNAIRCTKDIVKLKYFAKWLKAIPTIDPESMRPTAHWISDSGVCFAAQAPIVPTSRTAMTAAVTGSRKSLPHNPRRIRRAHRMNIGTVIKCCPLCGGRIVVSNLYQYSLDYTMRKDGKISKRHKRGDDGPVDVSLASCENYKTCDARWEEEEFFVEPDGTFYDYKYSKDE